MTKSTVSCAAHKDDPPSLFLPVSTLSISCGCSDDPNATVNTENDKPKAQNQTEPKVKQSEGEKLCCAFACSAQSLLFADPRIIFFVKKSQNAFSQKKKKKKSIWTNNNCGIARDPCKNCGPILQTICRCGQLSCRPPLVLFSECITRPDP